MHAAIAALEVVAGRVLAAATPSPTPTGPPADTVTPGPWGFVAIAFLALAVVFLLWDMMRRIRRARYRAQVQEELDAEQAEGQAAVRATDDEDVDAGGDDRSTP
ncbi:hypothetical protein [Microbacterium sp.]|uniref:hypothetical protein n=1 Tax=Microbacterium sp. TaxID=51671 RepID=UPI003A931757